ncbi:hypothetical protein HYG81_18765 [Natrinema zhouii]|uniref:hypothetical protein n=1 Tax=Natrinema zhouii TaxID=1710539 RepID=UPI001CFFCE40|nr:hypothetical protein [Natrinema zhouii]UHQ97901.1 hypothetical protein HYG81_18765 [Natrinema zhouii]
MVVSVQLDGFAEVTAPCSRHRYFTGAAALGLAGFDVFFSVVPPMWSSSPAISRGE